jgi:hypothetical protein
MALIIAEQAYKYYETSRCFSILSQNPGKKGQYAET